MKNVYLGFNSKSKEERNIKNYDNSSNPSNESFDYMQLPNFGFDLFPWSNILMSKVEKLKRFRKIRVNTALPYVDSRMFKNNAINYKL